MSKPIPVDAIVISTGGFSPEQDPYGQGAGWVSAAITVGDPEVVENLRQAALSRSEIIVRCVNLEVEGRIGQNTVISAGMPFELVVLDIRYIKPKQSWQ